MGDHAADRLAIHELLSSYAWAMADRDWEAWRAVFSDDARVDYSTAGGPVAPVDDAVEWIRTTLSGFDVTLSHGGNVVVCFDDDDTAAVRSLYKIVMKMGGDAPSYLEACGWYADKVVRTDAGWRIAERVEHLAYVRPT